MKLDANKLQEINDFLAKVPGTIGLAAGLVKALMNLKKRRAEGQPDPTLNEFLEEIDSNAGQMIENSDNWFASNPGYDPETGNRLPQA